MRRYSYSVYTGEMTMTKVTYLFPYLMVYLLTMSLIDSADKRSCYKRASRKSRDGGPWKPVEGATENGSTEDVSTMGWMGGGAA